MLPVFGRIFSEPIPAYFALVALGFTAATFLGARWAKRSGLDHDVIIDLGLLSVLAGVAGARLLHVVADGYFWDYVHLCTDPERVVWHSVSSPAECQQLGGAWDSAGSCCHAQERDCLAWAKFWNGGLTYYGGLISASGFGLWLLNRERFPVWKATDMAGMMIPLGIFFGRMGCFFGGCCFGLPTDCALGVSFPGGSSASLKQFQEQLLQGKGLPSLPVHPTQLYEALGCLAIAGLAAFWMHPRKRFDGQVFCFFLASYAALRFGLEYLRADDRGGFLGVSTSQLLGIAAILSVAWLWMRLRGRGRRLVASESPNG